MSAGKSNDVEDSFYRELLYFLSYLYYTKGLLRNLDAEVGRVMYAWTGVIWLRILFSVGVVCEQGNTPSSSTKGRTLCD